MGKTWLSSQGTCIRMYGEKVASYASLKRRRSHSAGSKEHALDFISLTPTPVRIPFKPGLLPFLCWTSIKPTAKQNLGHIAAWSDAPFCSTCDEDDIPFTVHIKRGWGVPGILFIVLGEQVLIAIVPGTRNTLLCHWCQSFNALGKKSLQAIMCLVSFPL